MNTAEIIAITQPVISANGNLDTGAPFMSVDEFVAYVARVSNPSNQNNMLLNISTGHHSRWLIL